MNEVNGKVEEVDYIVTDASGEVKDCVCATRAEAEKWVHHLMEWRPRSRPVIRKEAKK